MDYLFTSDTTEMAIPIAIYDDDVLNGQRRFFISIPALSLINRGGLRAREVIPYHLEAYIQDDEGITISVLSLHYNMIQCSLNFNLCCHGTNSCSCCCWFRKWKSEYASGGGKPATVCVGFDISMGNVSIEETVYIRIDVISKANNPGSGYGKICIDFANWQYFVYSVTIQSRFSKSPIADWRYSYLKLCP